MIPFLALFFYLSSLFTTTMALDIRQDPGTPTTTAPASPSETPQLVFDSIIGMITCTPFEIAWLYSGPEGLLVLDITDSDVPQSPNPPVIKRPLDSPISFIIASDADPLALNYTWPAVQVPQGSYVVEALMYSNGVRVLSAQSTPFQVFNGTDTSCVVAIPSPSSSVSRPIKSAPPTSSPSSSVGGSVLNSGTQKINKGLIAGSIVGAIALVSILSICFTLLRRNRYRRSPASRQWGGLGSTDSHALTNGKFTKFTTGSVSPQLKNHSKSKKTPLAPPTRLEQRMSDPFSNKHAAPGGGRVVGRTSDEDVTASSHSEEKIVADNGSPVVVIGAGGDAISPLPYTNPTRRSSLNSASVRNREREGSNGSFTVESAVYANGATTTRRKSVDYRTPSSLTRSHSTTAGEQQQQQNGAEMVPMGRSLSTGSSAANARKTARKPVPQYNPAEFAHNLKGGRRRGSQLDHDHDHDGGDDGGGGGGGGERNGNGNGGSVHSSFAHGNSHGDRERDVGRPVHYLIPDMPLA